MVELEEENGRPKLNVEDDLAIETPDTSIKEEKSTFKIKISAHDLLMKPLEEIKKVSKKNKEDIGKRETHNLISDMKILTAIMLGKKKNKELSQVLNTDKSFTSKQIKELEEKGLVTKETHGREVSYEVNQSRLLEFLQSRVVIKWKKKK